MGRPKKNPEMDSEIENDAAQGVENGAAAEQRFSKEEVQAMIAEASAKAVAEAMANLPPSAPQVVQVAKDEEMVQFLFQAEVSPENSFEIGPQAMYGRIVGSTGTFQVPKRDLSRVMDSMFRLLLDRRWIIVVDGLSDKEREALGVAYREGELLDREGFRRMVDLGKEMLKIYPKLCKGHRDMVAQRYHEAYLAKNRNVTREIVTEINRMSRELGSEKGDFTDIIEAMNEADKG